MKSLSLALAAAAALLVTMGSPAHAETLTFDDLPGDGSDVPAGYGGLTWNNFGAISAATADSFGLGGSGFDVAATSGANFAAQEFSGTASFSVGSLLDLYSADFTSAFDPAFSGTPNDAITVKGYLNGTPVDSTTFNVVSNTATHVNFDWYDINEVTFTPYDTNDLLLMDTLTVDVPEAPSWTLMLMGVGAVAASLAARRQTGLPTAA